MIWSQAIVKGRLTVVGDGVWSGDTFRASVIEIGGQRLQGIRAARCLLDRMETGKEMELLICSAHIYGIRVDGETCREGALRQLGWALLVAVVLGSLFLPLALASLIFIRRAYAIYSF
ncbi:hypothetical protein [Candidatus Ferrigenium straubiae]|jgi:hypothetical protein|uniref:hypothetical protein n=1 Tax=Candidatus Ferrigenium straubiae TaxID=2919506 RepID=UPI003F4A968B